MSGWSSRLKGVLFEEDNQAPSPAPDTGVQQVASPAAPAPAVRPNVVVFASPTGVVDPEIKAKLDEAVTASNQVSYTEFMTFLNSMAAVIPDEGSRYRAALAAAGAKGFSATEIIRGIDAILATIRHEEREVKAEIPQQVSRKVGAREQELANIEQGIRDRTAQIAALQTEIGQLNAQKGSVAATINTERQKIEEFGRKFEATVAVEVNRYETEKQRISAYGGGAQ